jgi:Ni,Fe-hydrogenase III small subunit
MKKFFLVLFVFTLFAANSFAQPQYYNYNNGTSSNTFPFGQVSGKAVNWLFLPGDFNQPSPLPPGQRITKVYFFITTAGTRTFTNLHILMAQSSSLTTLTSGQFYPGPWDTVFYKATTTLTATANGWMSIELSRPYVYNPARSLIMFVGQCGATGSGMYIRQSTITNIRRVWSVGGCPFTPYTGGDAAIVNFGVDVEPVVPDFYNHNTTGGDNSFPLNQPAGKMVQWLVGPGEFNLPTPALGGGYITGLYFRISGTYPLGPAAYTNFNILLGQTAITSFTSGSFFSGVMDTVYHRANVTLQEPVNSWLYFPLYTPVAYNPALSLVIEMGQCGASGTYTGYCLTHTNVTGSNRRVWSVGGCPFVPSASAGVNVVNCGIDIAYPTGVSSNNNNIPGEYKLGQNYPNPFNPSTTISFSLPKAGDVKLVVFDMLGREVATLVNGFTGAGNHTVDFDASNFSSGVYLYRIQAGDFKDVKKMMLVK